MREPTANGTLIAMVEPEGASLIAERYQRHYKRPLSTDAAYGYDAIAIASGIIRTKGATGLNAEGADQQGRLPRRHRPVPLTPSGHRRAPPEPLRHQRRQAQRARCRRPASF
jgi:hypothetical protein